MEKSVFQEMFESKTWKESERKIVKEFEIKTDSIKINSSSEISGDCVGRQRLRMST